MIKVNELRIGNWVMAPLYDYMQVNQIGHIDNDKYISAGTKESFGQNGFSPIPLTSEILEKCGFLINTDYDILAYKDTAICCYWDGVEYCFKYGLDADLTFASCEYLHQLQNLYFALIGEELIINL